MNRRQIVLGVVVGLAVVVVLLLGFALGRSGGDSSSTSSPRTITVTGTGKVEATPDVADDRASACRRRRRRPVRRGPRPTRSWRACSRR